MSKPQFVIVNSNGEFFNGDWSRIKWTPEYPNARTYNVRRIALETARKLSVEVANEETVRCYADYGLDSQEEIWTLEECTVHRAKWDGAI